VARPQTRAEAAARGALVVGRLRGLGCCPHSWPTHRVASHSNERLPHWLTGIWARRNATRTATPRVGFQIIAVEVEIVGAQEVPTVMVAFLGPMMTRRRTTIRTGATPPLK
jgi:hypothetical protein